MSRSKRVWQVLATMLVVSLIAAGCGDDDDDSSASGGGSGDGEGSIWVLLPDTASSDRWEQDDRRFFTEGVTLAVAGVQHSDEHDLLPPRVKHRSRMFWHVAEKKVTIPGAVPVVLNQRGIGDTAIGAILAVAGDTVIRPVAGTVLDSISVQVVGELCGQLGLKIEWP